MYTNSAGRDTLYTRVTERMFKRYVISPAAGTPKGVFFIFSEDPMNIFIYSDESGVLDKTHNAYFVFGGLMFFSREDRDLWSRKYTAAENIARRIEGVSNDSEVKAAVISNKSKSKLYRSLNHTEKFGVVISQHKLMDRLFENKKGKQRYLDWAYKMSVKTKFEDLIEHGVINPEKVEGLYFFVDEHSTATNGIYELKESLEQEFKFGTYNFEWNSYHAPIFKNLQRVCVEYCNSATKTLVRAADIVSNHIFYKANLNAGKVEPNNNLTLYYHP